VFALIDAIPGAPAPPGPWTVRPAPVSFRAGEADAPGQIWRADLLADPLAARVALGAAREQLRAHEAALATAEERLSRAVYTGVSFSTSAEQRGPERALQGMVQELRSEAAAPPGGASFTIRETAPPAWIAAEAQLRAFVAQAQETIAAYALVETRVAQALIGRTRVHWGGDVRSHLAANVSVVQAELHRRTLTLALRSRAALLRVFGIVLRGARIVAQMISSPVGTVTALPAAWNFVQEVLREARGSYG
jgi:hypothetical protein